MKKTLVLVFLAVAAGARAESLFTVPWGKDAGQLGYYNRSTPPFDQPYGEGPGGIASGPNGEVWISDQFNDRVLRFDRSGKALGTVSAPGDAKIVKPRALWTDGKSTAVVSAKDMVVLWWSEASKKIETLDKVDGKGWPQVEAVQGTPAGELWVGDVILGQMVRFDGKGGAPAKRRWESSGVSTDAEGNVYTLEYRPGKNGTNGENWLVSTDAKGQQKDRFPLNAPELEAPYLVGVDAAGNAVIRFIKTLDPKTAGPGNPHRFLIVRYDPAGKEGKPLGETLVSVVTQQFVLTPEGSVLGLSFEAMTAPQGSVEVVEFK